jgi:K+-sensing histidine kinase KdpD
MDSMPEGHAGARGDERLGSAVAGILAFGACLAASALMLGFRTTLGPWIPYAVFVAIVLLFGRSAGVLMGPYIGLVAAFFFDFFFTRPYGSIHIESDSQLIACVLLIVLGLVLGVLRWFTARVREAGRRAAARESAASTAGLVDPEHPGTSGSSPPNER